MCVCVRERESEGVDGSGRDQLDGFVQVLRFSVGVSDLGFGIRVRICRFNPEKVQSE